MDLDINDRVTVIRNDSRAWWCQTPNAFGNILDELKEYFPGGTAAYAERLRNCIDGSQDVKLILGAREYGQSLVLIESILDGLRANNERCVIVRHFAVNGDARDKYSRLKERWQTYFTINLQEFEEIRVKQQLRTCILPQYISPFDGSMHFNDVQTVGEAMLCLLYFAAYRSLKICTCVHCGRLFFTDCRKQEYCARLSPLSGSEIAKKISEPTCKNVVQYLTGKAAWRLDKTLPEKARRALSPVLTASSIRKSADSYDAQQFIESFVPEYRRLHIAACEEPSPENICALWDFLRTSKAEVSMKNKGGKRNGSK